MIHTPPMPYPENALEPYLSAATVHFHRRKQERYVQRTNALLRGSPLADRTLDEIVVIAERDQADDPWLESVFDQASQAWNHALMWRSMAPPGRRHVPGWVRGLRSQWIDAADSLFASGWVWLSALDGRPVVQATNDADRPEGLPLAVMDLWEHAYYLDYPDQKAEYVKLWWDELADWSVVEQIMDGDIPRELR